MKIAIIGANGQVGREVSLFLSVMGIEVVPISRTEIGGVFLERCGLNCRYGSVGNQEDAKRLFDGCDLVADFAHPHGLPAKVRQAVKSNIDNAVRHAPHGSPYVYMSTISAFGMPTDDAPIKTYRLAHTMYAADKRYLERHALAQQSKRDIYVLRLSQVHGELQRVSQEFIEETACGKVSLPFSVNTVSYTVFCFTIAQALVNIAQGKERPGRYTLVSTPAWSWGEVYRYWARKSGTEVTFLTDPNLCFQQSSYRQLLNLGHFLLTPVLRLGMAHKQPILNYLSMGSQRIQERMQAEYLRRRAVSEIAQGRSKKEGRKFQIGEVPGQRLASLSDSRLTMEKATQAVRTIITSSEPCVNDSTLVQNEIGKR